MWWSHETRTEYERKGGGEQEQANNVRLDDEGLGTSAPSRSPIFSQYTKFLRFVLTPELKPSESFPCWTTCCAY